MPQSSGSTRDSKAPTLHAEFKAPGGKLLRATCRIAGSNLETVKITGDFFLHPEEDLTELEEELVGVKMEEGEIRKAVQAFFKKRKSTIIGAEPEDFVSVILKAVKTSS